MRFTTAFMILSVMAASSWAGRIGVGGGAGPGIGDSLGLVRDIHSYPQYKYSYAVADKLTGDRKTATEVRDGKVTRGSYSFVQPDGVLRTVVYTSDPIHGFRAQVINKGIGGHPAPRRIPHVFSPSVLGRRIGLNRPKHMLL